MAKQIPGQLDLFQRSGMENDSKRYCVVWCDHEGSQQQRTFSNLEDACTEYNYVNECYDGADILDESGKSVRE